MTDITDSYCERCGARYVFGPPVPKNLSLKGARVLAKGLKNFVLTDGQSMADSLTLARNEDQHEDSSRMTEAFHRTFNFCMTCRQYACDRCWNPRVGACYSCAPEPGHEPVAPEDHLIVRTPVARWDTDWSIFPDGPAVEPVARPAPVPFNEPIRFSDPEPVLPSEPAAPSAWPVADLPAAVSVPTGPGGKSGRRSSSKQVDPQAASLWPIADELAPEMTLTPEEMDIVELGLGYGETSQDDAPGQRSGPEREPLAASPAFPNQGQTAAEDLARAAEWTAIAPSQKTPSAPAWVVKNVEPHSVSAVAPSIDAQSVDAASDAPIPTGPSLSVPVAPQPAAPGHPTPEPQTREHNPFVERLLGRHAPRNETPATTRPTRGRAPRGQPAGDPWPHATPWSQRPVESREWRDDADAPAGEAEPTPADVLPLLAPAAEPEPAATRRMVAPSPRDAGRPAVISHHEMTDVGARSAAAVRLSAVSGANANSPVSAESQSAPLDGFASGPSQAGQAAAPTPAEPIPPAETMTPWAVQPPLFDMSDAYRERESSPTPEPPARPEIDRDVVDATRRKPSKPPERTQVRHPSDAAPTPEVQPERAATLPTHTDPWPPLGSTWPATEDHSAPWAGPDAPSVLSVVAAQQAGPMMVTEMWAQSSEEVLNRGSVRVCHRCALPVSTQARFCRRCGTPQG